MPRSLPSTGALLALTLLAGAAQATPVFALANGSSTLVRFDTATPGTVTMIGALSGATTTLSGIDFRPFDGALYGYSAATAGIYRVDTNTGATTLVSTSGPAAAGTAVGIDFNPAADRLRVVSDAESNLRINVATGATLVDGTLAYAPMDVNAGRNPTIVEAAYTNNDNNPATATTLYYIDNALDVLVRTANPNAGVLDTVGALGVDADGFLGFDIFTDTLGVNLAFASLRVAGAQGLYAINLTTGAASLIGAIGLDQINSLAVATVAEPGTLALSGAAALALVALSRRRKAQPPTLRAAF